MSSISICTPKSAWKEKYLSFLKQNETFHKPWVAIPATDKAFKEYLERYDGVKHVRYWVIKDNDIAGVFNLNNLILGKFKNAFLGYFGSKKFSGTGAMSKGFKLVCEKAFGELGLHRLECAIQPENTLSLRFIRRLGFHFEGYAPKYLHLNGKWTDHFKWSLTKEQWHGKSFASGAAELSDYNPKWPSIFEDIRESISEALSEKSPLEHIGSTSVPELAAKPIIDIQMGVRDLKDISKLKEALEKLGLEFVTGVNRDHVPFGDIEHQKSAWEKRFFRGKIKGFHINLHIRILGNHNWRFAILFRDFLRANDKARIAYEQVKKRLSDLNLAGGVYAYTKDPVCDLIYLQAEEWASKTKWRKNHENG